MGLRVGIVVEWEESWTRADLEQTDRSGYAQCVFSFCEVGVLECELFDSVADFLCLQGLGHEVIQFVGTTDGRIVRPRGPRDFGCEHQRKRRLNNAH